MDRGYGRPIQAVDMVLIGKKLSELTTQELVELNTRLMSSSAVVADGDSQPEQESFH